MREGMRKRGTIGFKESGPLSQGLKLTFLGRRQLVNEFFLFQSPDGKMWSPKSVNKIFPSQRNTNTQSFSRLFLRENSPTPERSQEQESDSVCKGIKILRSLQLVETEFLLNR